MNVAFGSAARRLSRHQLYKHVNVHVYLGVLAYYAKQRSHEYVCAGHRVDQQVDRPKSVAQLRNPRFGVCNLISRISVASDPASGARNQGIHYMYNTLWFRERRVWVTSSSVTWFASSELEDQTVRVFRDVHVFVAYWSNHVAAHRRT